MVVRRGRSCIWVALVAILTIGPANAREMLIRNIIIVDTEAASEAAALRRGEAFVIDGGRIRSVVPDRRAERRGRTVINGHGRYALPGLIDMHVHLIDRVPNSMKLFFAHGVMFVRDMGNEMQPDEARRLRAAVISGEMPGPDFISAGRILEGGPRDGSERFYSYIAPETDAGPTARKVKADGWDFVKTYNRLTRKQYFEIAEAANAVGVRFGGHLPYSVSLAEAIVAGQSTLEHARDIVNGCTKAPVARPVDGFVARSAVLAVFDPDLCTPALASMRSAGMGYVPTHVTRLFDVVAARPSTMADPRWKYVSPELARFWTADIAATSRRAAGEQAIDQPYFEAGLQVTKRAVDAGVMVMAGSDANDSLQVPGLSLHEELTLMSSAGLTPLQVLQAATVVPSRFLEIDRGSLAPGRQAKILFLGQNPLVDIRNTKTIAAIFDGRRIWNRTKLDRMLAEVRADAAKSANGASALKDSSP